MSYKTKKNDDGQIQALKADNGEWEVTLRADGSYRAEGNFHEFLFWKSERYRSACEAKRVKSPWAMIKEEVEAIDNGEGSRGDQRVAEVFAQSAV